MYLLTFFLPFFCWITIESFNHPINNLPKTLLHLKLGSSFNQTLNIFYDTIKFLEISGYNFKFDNI